MRLWAFSLIIVTPTITPALLLEKLKHVSITSFGIKKELRVCGVQYFELWQHFTPPPTGTDSLSGSPPTNKTQSRGLNVCAFAQGKLLEQPSNRLIIFTLLHPFFWTCATNIQRKPQKIEKPGASRSARVQSQMQPQTGYQFLYVV